MNKEALVKHILESGTADEFVLLHFCSDYDGFSVLGLPALSIHCSNDAIDIKDAIDYAHKAMSGGIT